MIDFALPELGENIAGGDVLRVLVKLGDVLAKDQAVLELETDKATIEVPSSVEGRIADIKVKPGDKVKVGQVVLTVEGSQPAAAGPKGAAGRAAAAADEATTVPAGGAAALPLPDARPTEAAKPVVDHGSGARATEPAGVAVPAAQGGVSAAPARLVPAAPSVRRVARELGVKIDEVQGSAAGGRITVEDVMAHAKRIVQSASRRPAATVSDEPLPDFTRWGAVERQPMRAVRRKTAEHLSLAWRTIPHVTQHDRADITELEELRKKYAKRAEASGAALTVTAIAIKVCAEALKVFPQFNTSVDMAAEEIVHKTFINVGVAVDTDRGLLVPVIRNADRKNIIELALELGALSEKARAHTIAAEQMQGGTFSISNLGGIGGTSFTPIVNYPEVAILGISRAKTEPVWVDGQFVPRLLLPLSLSYDHRVIDGADGARFLRWIAEALGQPFLLALEG